MFLIKIKDIFAIKQKYMTMLPSEFEKMYSILESFLGPSKTGYDGNNTQLQFGCPHCIELYGQRESQRFNLEISLSKQMFNCWKCSSEDESDMHGSIFKLIKLYGNESLYKEYRECIQSLKESKLYNIDFNKKYNIDFSQIDELNLPKNFRPFKEDKYYPPKAMEYLQKRGIGWDIIYDFNMGFTTYDENDKISSNRIIIPSYNKFGELNYWTGRDFMGNDKRQKYYNPKVERKNIIFNEEKIQWDADITLVEGPFDHLVVPNSVPLLGKVLDKNFKLYWEILKNANANINVWCDGDAIDSVIKIYKNLNNGRLYNKIRYIPTREENDPSLLYQLGGRKAISEHLKNSKKIKEVYLQ